MTECKGILNMLNTKIDPLDNQEKKCFSDQLAEVAELWTCEVSHAMTAFHSPKFRTIVL